MKNFVTGFEKKHYWMIVNLPLGWLFFYVIGKKFLLFWCFKRSTFINLDIFGEANTLKVFQITPLWVPVLFIDIVVVDLRKETVSAPPGSLVTREDSLMESLQVCRLSTRGSNTEGLEGRSKGRNRVWNIYPCRDKVVKIQFEWTLIHVNYMYFVGGHFFSPLFWSFDIWVHLFF